MKKLLLTAMVALFALAQLSFAEDLNPPTWRGQPGTTLQAWEFSDGDPNPLPDWGDNTQGVPQMQVTPGFGQEWQATWAGRIGVWPLSGEIIVTIPNFPDLNPLKLIWIQLTWTPQVPGGVIQFLEETTFGTGVPGEGISGVLQKRIVLEENQVIPGEYWYHDTYLIVLPENPPEETILISGSVDVDELVIDTWCTIPEPGTMALVGVGILALLRRKK